MDKCLLFLFFSYQFCHFEGSTFIEGHQAVQERTWSRGFSGNIQRTKETVALNMNFQEFSLKNKIDVGQRRTDQ